MSIDICVLIVTPHTDLYMCMAGEGLVLKLLLIPGIPLYISIAIMNEQAGKHLIKRRWLGGEKKLRNIVRK